MTLFYSVIAFVWSGLAWYYYFNMIRKSPARVASPDASEQTLNYQQTIDFIKVNCKVIEFPEGSRDNIDYFSKFFSALGNDILFDAGTNSFISLPQKQFGLLPIEVNRQLGPFILKKSMCWAAMIEDQYGAIRVAYETKQGNIHVLQVAGFLQTNP